MLTNVSRVEAMLLSDELQAAIAGVRVTVGGDVIGVTASIGMTILSGDAADARAALTRADAAMYDVKAADSSAVDDAQLRAHTALGVLGAARRAGARCRR